MSYVPNFTNPRVSKRILKALAWVKLNVSKKPVNLHRDIIRRNLGDGDLGDYLRQELLVCVDSSYKKQIGKNKSWSKAYVLHQAGFERLLSIYEPKLTIPQERKIFLNSELQTVYLAHKEEIRSGRFKYRENRCARKWHGLQNLKRTDKDHFWSTVGYTWNSDIELCAPTLLYQFAQFMGMDEYLFGVRGDLLRQKDDFRNHVATLCFGPNYTPEDYQQAKGLINALFCGAKISTNYQYSEIFKLVHFEPKVIRALQNSKRVQVVREDISKIWSFLCEHRYFTPRSRDKLDRKKPLTPGQKWNFYFCLERELLEVIDQNLPGSYFWEHDGWRSKHEPDLNFLEEKIKTELGYRVNLKSKELTGPR